MLEYLKSLKFKNKDIETILKDEKIKLMRQSTILDNTKKLIEYLQNYLELYEIRKIIIDYPRILTYQNTTIKEKINDIQKLGFTQEQTIILLKKDPRITGRNIEEIKNKLKILTSLKLKKQYALKCIKEIPNIIGISEIELKDKILNLNKQGFTKKEITYIIQKCPKVLSYSKENVNNKIDNIHKLNILTKEETLTIISKFPNILSYDTETITSRIENLKNQNYTLENIKKTLLEFPQIISLDENKINLKIQLTKELNLLEIVLEKPKNLMVSIELLHARYMHTKKLGLELTKETGKILFRGERDYKSKFQKTTEELLKEYPYNKEATNGRNI